MTTTRFPLKPLGALLALTFSGAVLAAVSGVTISGTPQVGTTLTGSWSGEVGNAVYWYNTTDHTTLSTTTTYTPVAGDLGDTIKFYVTPASGPDVASSGVTIAAASSGGGSGTTVTPPPPEVATHNTTTTLNPGESKTLQLGDNGPIITLRNAAASTTPASITYTTTSDGKTVISSITGNATATLSTSTSTPIVQTGGNTLLTCPQSTTLSLSAGWAVTTIGSGFSNPHGVAVASDGTVFVADSNNHAIKRMSKSGSGYSAPEIISSGLSWPSGVAVASDGTVFVADTGNDAIKSMSKTGNGYSAPQSIGSGFSWPPAVAVASDGTVFVADALNNAIKIISKTGSSYSAPQSIGSGFQTPYGVGVASDGTVFVADSLNNAIKTITRAVSVAPTTGCTTVNSTASTSGNTTINPSSAPVRQAFGRTVRAEGNSFAANTTTVYAGETASLGKDGALNIRLGSLQQDGNQAGDPLPVTDTSSASYFTNQPSPRIDQTVARLGMSLLDAIGQDLGLPAGKLSQNNSGVVALPTDGSGNVWHFRPVGTISVVPGAADGFFLQADETFLYRKQGVQVTLTPAVLDPSDVINQLRQQDKTLKASVRPDGSYLVESVSTVNPAPAQVLRPSWYATGGRPFSGGGLVVIQPTDPQGIDASGKVKRYGDVTGWTTLVPWSSDLAGVKRSASQIDPAASVQVDSNSGTVSATLGGKTYRLLPSYTLQAPTADFTPGWAAGSNGQLNYRGMLGDKQQSYTLQ